MTPAQYLRALHPAWAATERVALACGLDVPAARRELWRLRSAGVVRTTTRQMDGAQIWKAETE